MNPLFTGSNPVSSATLLLRRNFIKEEGFIILQISQKEARYLESQGLKFGTNSYGDIHRSYSGHHKYWCTESEEAKKLLFEYRKSCIVKTVK